MMGPFVHVLLVIATDFVISKLPSGLSSTHNKSDSLLGGPYPNFSPFSVRQQPRIQLTLPGGQVTSIQLHLSSREVALKLPDIAKYPDRRVLIRASILYCKTRRKRDNFAFLTLFLSYFVDTFVQMPLGAQCNEPISVRAAKWLLAAQNRYQLTRTTRLQTDAHLKMLTIRYAAELFRVGKTQIGLNLKALKETGSPTTSNKNARRPRSLSDDEDAALEAYTYWLIRSGSLTSCDLIEDAANRLYARRTPPTPPVKDHWWLRWKADYPWYKSTYGKVVEAVRLLAEQ
jgi:hypothetical protein